jgi:hypothetical protein
MNVLSRHKQLKAFTATIISITTSWLEKYRMKSAKLGQFIVDLTLSTNEVMVDRISRYILLIALKNKNPILLRSIFSTFLSLIHRNIASLMSVSLTNVKVGYFRSMAHMFDDDENVKVVYDRHNMLIKSLVNTLKRRNRRRFKENYRMQKIFQSLIDPNIIDFMQFAPGEYSPVDEFQIYVLYGRYIQNTDNSKSNALRIKDDIRKCRSASVIKKYLNLKAKQKIYSLVEQYYKTEEATQYIMNKIKMDTAKELDPMCYITPDGDFVTKDIDEMYNEIDAITDTIHNYLAPKASA